jgi:hypothetical protein
MKGREGGKEEGRKVLKMEGALTIPRSALMGSSVSKVGPAFCRAAWPYPPL